MSDAERLAELGRRFGCDKVREHHYEHAYARLLGHRLHEPIAMLELGVYQGASARMFAAWFGNRFRYVGVDRELAHLDPLRQGLPDNAAFFEGDVTDNATLGKALDALGGAVDVVVDAASHRTCDQVQSFRALWPHVARRGLYFIEDLHTTFMPAYHPPGARTWLDVLRDLLPGFFRGEPGMILHVGPKLLVLEKP